MKLRLRVFNFAAVSVQLNGGFESVWATCDEGACDKFQLIIRAFQKKEKEQKMGEKLLLMRADMVFPCFRDPIISAVDRWNGFIT